jgi:crossover junction endodeoxyribonuclease RuvC
MGGALGIDPSVACSGYALVDDDDNIKDIGTIVTSAKDPEPKRLDRIYWEIKAMCETYKPDIVVMEDQFVGKNPQTSLYLARARGVAMLACYHAGVDVHLFSPSEIKKTMTGKGNAKKELVQAAAIEAYKHNSVIAELFGDGIKKSGKKKNDDISDALAAVYTYRNSPSTKQEKTA